MVVHLQDDISGIVNIGKLLGNSIVMTKKDDGTYGSVMILDIFPIFPTSERRGNPHIAKGNRYGSLPA